MLKLIKVAVLGLGLVSVSSFGFTTKFNDEYLDEVWSNYKLETVKGELECVGDDTLCHVKAVSDNGVWVALQYGYPGSACWDGVDLLVYNKEENKAYKVDFEAECESDIKEYFFSGKVPETLLLDYNESGKDPKYIKEAKLVAFN